MNGDTVVEDHPELGPLGHGTIRIVWDVVPDLDALEFALDREFGELRREFLELGEKRGLKRVLPRSPKGAV